VQKPNAQMKLPPPQSVFVLQGEYMFKGGHEAPPIVSQLEFGAVL
jgi:hypothetical protein